VVGGFRRVSLQRWVLPVPLYISMMPRRRRCPLNVDTLSSPQSVSHSELEDLPQHSHLKIDLSAHFWTGLSVWSAHALCARVHMCARVYTRVCGQVQCVCVLCCAPMCVGRAAALLIPSWTGCARTLCVFGSACVRVRSRVRTRVCVRCVCVARLKPFDFFV
jgi:hypothetical protein